MLYVMDVVVVHTLTMNLFCYVTRL